MQIFRKTECLFYARLRDCDFLVEIDLTSMGFVRNTDYIATVSQQSGVLGKLMNGGQKYPTALPALQQIPEVFS